MVVYALLRLDIVKSMTLQKAAYVFFPSFCFYKRFFVINSCEPNPLTLNFLKANKVKLKFTKKVKFIVIMKLTENTELLKLL